jgi:hypothetical protein
MLKISLSQINANIIAALPQAAVKNPPQAEKTVTPSNFA